MLNLPNNYRNTEVFTKLKRVATFSIKWIKSKFVNLLFRQSEFSNQIRTNLELSVREKVRDFVDSSLGDGSWVARRETSWPGMEDVLINVGARMEAVRVVVGLVGVVVASSAINRWRNSDVEAWVEEDHFLG